jgi:hypothetical protein
VSNRVKSIERLIGCGRMHRRFDDAERHRVHADAAFGIFDGSTDRAVTTTR